MASVVIYHPGTGASATVAEESVGHYRPAGWLLHSEWDAQQATETRGKGAAAKTAGEEKES